MTGSVYTCVYRHTQKYVNTYIYKYIHTHNIHCFLTTEECVSDEEDEGQVNETLRQGKKGVICPDIPDEKQSTQERGVHDENGTCSSNYLIVVSFLLSLVFV